MIPIDPGSETSESNSEDVRPHYQYWARVTDNPSVDAPSQAGINFRVADYAPTEWIHLSR
jgi:hypothetical protein